MNAYEYSYSYTNHGRVLSFYAHEWHALRSSFTANGYPSRGAVTHSNTGDPVKNRENITNAIEHDNIAAVMSYVILLLYDTGISD